MTDNRTTELREKLTERGVDYEVKDLPNIKFFHDTRWNANGVRWCYTEFVGATTCLTMCNEWKDCTPEQAIAATLGSEPPYDELLRCLENDWHIRASWDGLRKFWCVELTEEGVKLRDASYGMLTADDIRDLIERHSDESGGNGRDFHNGAYVAIADELNALAERTCECVSEYAESPFDGKTIVLHRCSECHELMRPHMLYCPNCGAKVVSI